MAMAGKLLIVGFGNTLAGDDGAGPAVVARLLELGLPRNARAVDGGGDSLRLLGLWQHEDEVWLVDAVAGGAPPGTIRRLGHEAVMSVPQRHATVHRLSLPESLRWIALAYPEMAAVRYRFWGIEAAGLELAAGLSPAVLAAVDKVVAEIAVALAEQDAPPTAELD
jgi:hydrogenase maturation protease